MIAYLKARWGEASSHLGIVCAAVAAGAVAASALATPWSYAAFIGAAGLYLFPQKRGEG